MIFQSLNLIIVDAVVVFLIYKGGTDYNISHQIRM